MMLCNVAGSGESPIHRGTNASMHFPINQLYCCPPRCGKRCANLQCTPIHKNGAVVGTKELKLLRRDFPPVECIHQRGANIREIRRDDVKNASTAELLLPPEAEMPNEFALVPSSRALEYPVV